MRTLITTALLALASSAQAATTTYDFNDLAQYNANFASRGGFTSNYGGTTVGGLNNSGSAVAVASDSTATSVNQTRPISINTGVTVSGYFKTVAGTPNGSGPNATFQLGVVASPTDSFAGVADSLSIRINSQTKLLEFASTSSSLAPVGTPGGPAAPTITATFTDGPNGLGRLYDSTTAAAAFRGATQPAGTAPTFNAANVDNFSVTDGVVPEPATLGLLGFGGMTLLRRRR